MSNQESEKDDGHPHGVPKKGKLPLILGGGLLVLALGGGTGVFLAPKFSAPSVAATAEQAAPPAPKEEPPLTVQWPPLVVDVHGEGGGTRHVKIVITLECVGDTNEKKARAFSPRARAKVLTFIREQKFEQLTDSAEFALFQEQVTKLVKENTDSSVKNVWITDFVAQ